MQDMTKFDIVRIWGSDVVGWEFVGSDGTSNDLLLMWNDMLFKMNNCYKGERWLCVEGVLLKNEFNCVFFLVYGAHTRVEKLTVGEELSFIAGLCQVPICYMGDFNEVIQIEERKGQDRLTMSAEDFKNWIQDMQLLDLPLNNRKFTWFRGRSCSCIDRVLLSVEWIEEFSKIRLKGGPRGLSDHCPIIVEDSKFRGGPRPFQSLDFWFTYEGFLRIVREEWRNLGELQFIEKLKALTLPLGRWQKDKFGDVDKKIQHFEEKIKRIDDMAGNGIYDGTVETRRKALVSCCKQWYVRKEVHWKQMSRSKLAKDIDKNTKYFHNLASATQRNNRIDALVINRRLIKNHARIKIAIREFYKDLYQQKRLPVVGFRDGLVNRIDEEESVALERMPTTEEVREVVWDCESSMATGSDGYNMNFIKKCWDDIGAEFTSAVLEFFRSSRLPSDSNITWVALAPKFTGAKEIKDLRPISMVGCVFKVISKVMVRRMISVMLGLVGETQSAFVKVQKIHDGALIACETVQWLKMRKMEAAIIKLDFQKA
ncbi:uncharacterized protein LOC107478701 [Arachis duranensis]|uniref:Uncharacterized protein LOC107478701 n=1 Tax=Arachis duranensis TaxID=130453 RepID=A0A6P4CMX3_ARADU|nr:uncharacterized protein LOC107478701 [Arachis duranensis]